MLWTWSWKIDKKITGWAFDIGLLTGDYSRRKEIAQGVHGSASGLKQFRMTSSDILGLHGKIGPHFNFEILNKAGKTVKNYHMPIR